MKMSLKRDLLIMALGEVIEEWLSSNGIKWFQGGSRRFGYNNGHSDVDYFIYTHDTSVMINLSEVGFELPTMHLEKRYPAISYSFQDLIHVCIIREQCEFDNLRTEHDHLVDIFELNHDMKKIAKNMRTHLSGAEVYRVFMQSFPIKWTQ